MTEHKCGSAESCQFGEMCKPNYDIGGCSHFKQKKPLTNEEWLQTASTEQLAEWIVHIADQCTISHECNMCGLWCDEKQVIEWLKAPHHSEVEK